MNIRNLACIALSAVLLSSCATSHVKTVFGKNKLSATCEPSQLEIRQNKVDATISLEFPAEYMTSTSMLVVTPQLVYDGGKRIGKPIIYQGTAIQANHKVVPAEGCTHTFQASFDYTPGIEQSFLELKLVMMSGQKKFNLPSMKVADGCNFTYTLADLTGEYQYKSDGYTQKQTVEAETTINYDVNSSVVKKNSTNRNAVAQYRQQIADFMYDDSYKVTGTGIVAFASPEGGQEYNAKLSDDRAQTAVKALSEFSQAPAPDSIVLRGLGQDWEGFRDAVELSDIEDKNLILRLLEMYDDPAQREEEIRNLSEVFEELKTEVFPLLRRATYVVTAEKTGRSDEEIAYLAENYISSLSEAEILRAATNEKDLKTKEFYYRTALQRFHSDVAGYNMALVSIDRQKYVVARAYLDALNQSDPDVQNAQGVIELRLDNPQAALNLFEAAEGNEQARINAGAANIALGNYETACKNLKGTGSFNEALALVLCNKEAEADKILDPTTPKAAYLKAIIAARKGDKTAADQYLKMAYSDENLKARAIKDVEFVDFR